MHALVLLAALATGADEPMVTLARTGCFGSCPAYKISVWSDGRVEFKGRAYVKTKGQAKGQLTPDDVAALKAAFIDAGYLKWGTGFDCYEATDNPTVTTSFRDGAAHHTIEHYYGCRSKPGLDALTKLEARVDELVHIERWIGTVEERRALKRP
jgi:hypothetical protein